MNLCIIPYKSTDKNINKYHIVDNNNKLIHYNLCNVYAPFGRQTEKEHHTSNKIVQHRLNICFTKDKLDTKEYNIASKIITDIETWFSNFKELTDFKLISSLIDRKKFGKVIRFHLKTLQNTTTTPLLCLNNGDEKTKSWIDFNKEMQINIKFHPDCFWINNLNKTFGISFVIDKVYQLN